MSLFSRATTFSLAGLRLPTTRSRGISNGNTPFGDFSEEEIKFRNGRGGKRGGASWYGGRIGRRRLIKLFLGLIVVSVRLFTSHACSTILMIGTGVDFLLHVRITRGIATLFERMGPAYDLADSTPLVDMLRSGRHYRLGVQHDSRFVAFVHRIAFRDRNEFGEGLFRFRQYDPAESVKRNGTGGAYGVSHVLASGSTTVGKATNLVITIDTRDAGSS